MPARRNLPIVLPGAEWTEIIREVVVTGPFGLRQLLKDAKELFPDGLLPGEFKLKAVQRLNQYLDNTDPQDYEKVFDPDFEMKLRMGLGKAPVSPYWLKLLAVPGQFTEKAKDFKKLLERGEPS